MQLCLFGQIKISLDFINEVYKRESLMKTYSHIIRPVTIENLELDDTNSPIVRKQAGRPKKVRLRNRSELVSAYSPIVCSLCQQSSHNNRTCERRQAGMRIEKH